MMLGDAADLRRSPEARPFDPRPFDPQILDSQAFDSPAGFVPIDFWNEARRQMDRVKPAYWLAEWQSRDMEARSFDMLYAWSWYDAVRSVSTGKKQDLSEIFTYYSWNEKFYPRDGIAMTFVSNHDQNAWEGTEFEQFGPGLDAAIVLASSARAWP